MAKPRGAFSGGAEEEHATGDCSAENLQSPSRAQFPDADLLDYMSDMLIELRSISDQHRWKTLSGLLALAHAEAVARRDEVISRHHD